MSHISVVPQATDSCSYTCGASGRNKGRLSDDLALDLAEVFGVLADSTRLKIIATLMDGEVCVCDIAERLGLRQSTVSHQLRLLRNLRLVSHRKEGRTVYYQLSDEHVGTLLQQTLDHLLEERALTNDDSKPRTATPAEGVVV